MASILRVTEAECVSTASGLRFHVRSLCAGIFVASGFHALDFFRLPVFRDGDVLLAEVFEQIFLGVHPTGGTADDADHVVEMIQVRSGTRAKCARAVRLSSARRLSGAGSRPMRCSIKRLDHRDQAQLARPARNNGEQDHAERFLHLRVFEQIVQDELRLFAALQLDDDAHCLRARIRRARRKCLRAFVVCTSSAMRSISSRALFTWYGKFR